MTPSQRRRERQKQAALDSLLQKLERDEYLRWCEDSTDESFGAWKNRQIVEVFTRVPLLYVLRQNLRQK